MVMIIMMTMTIMIMIWWFLGRGKSEWGGHGASQELGEGRGVVGEVRGDQSHGAGADSGGGQEGVEGGPRREGNGGPRRRRRRRGGVAVGGGRHWNSMFDDLTEEIRKKLCASVCVCVCVLRLCWVGF